MSDKIKYVSDTSFQQDVLEAQIPVVVDFWAPWCGPCRMLAPVFEELAEEYAGRLIFAKINTDENPNTPSKLGVRGIPTMIFYLDGEEVERLVGFQQKPQLKRKFDAILVEAKPK
jgi:thioredoxin 1